MKKHIIWTSQINLDDWQEYLQENELLDETGYAQYYAVCELNSDLEDERENLNIRTDGSIIAIADLGLWGGRVCGYKEIDGRNIAACLWPTVRGLSENTWYIDEVGDLRQEEIHHDGTNHILYRELKNGLSEKQVDNFYDKLYNGTATRADITRYTRTLGDRVCAVYGWKHRLNKAG